MLTLPKPVKDILNLPYAVIRLLYSKDNPEDLDMLNFLIAITFGLFIYFCVTKDITNFPPYLVEVLSYLLMAKFGAILNNTFKQTGGLTIQRHIYSSPSQVKPNVIRTTNSAPNSNIPKQSTTIIDDEGNTRTGKSIHVEGNSEEEI